MAGAFRLMLALWLGLCAATSLAAPNPVIVGAYINDIQGVDLGKNTHTADFYLWFRWQGKGQNPAKDIEYMNAATAVDHTNVIQFDPAKPQPDGSLYTIIHHQGQFSSKLPLHNYPFDHQVLTIQIEDAQMGADQRTFVADSNPAMLDSEIHLPGYEIGQPRLRVLANSYPTNFGDQSASGASTYSRIVIEIPIRRPWVSGFFKVLLPIVLILIAAVLGLAVRPDHIEARMGLGITALLTMVASQFSMAASLPEVSYLMLIDRVYIASYLVIVAVLGIIVHDSWHSERRGMERVARWNKRAIYLLLGVYLGSIGFSVGSALLS